MDYRKKLPDICFSIIIIVIGVCVAWQGAHLSIGSLSRIGPGAFPFGLGIVLAILGLISLFENLTNKEKSNNEYSSIYISSRAIISIVLSILLFAFFAEFAGLVLSISILVLVIMWGMRQLKISTALITITMLSIIGVVLFINALNLPINAFFTG